MLTIAIVGLPNVGKSTLFNALTKSSVLAANYPFATIEPNTGIVPLPDPRLETLAKLYNCNKIVHASVTFVDIAGLVAGASKGEGLGNQFLTNIRECAAVCHVIRAFNDKNVLHVDNEVDPAKDIEVIELELVLADLQTVEKRLPRLEKEMRSDPKIKLKHDLLVQMKETLNCGIPLNKKYDKESLLEFKDLGLLSAKPTIYLFNVDVETLASSDKKARLKQLAGKSSAVFVCAKLEQELNDLDSSDATELSQSYGVTSSSLDQLALAAYETLGLQSFLTAGEKETRAWTIAKGSTASQAAGVIHGDFEKGFIAAQIVDYFDLVAAGSENLAKAAGKIRTEGKSYMMQPNDVVEFRFNV